MQTGVVIILNKKKKIQSHIDTNTEYESFPHPPTDLDWRKKPATLPPRQEPTYPAVPKQPQLPAALTSGLTWRRAEPCPTPAPVVCVCMRVWERASHQHQAHLVSAAGKHLHVAAVRPALAGHHVLVKPLWGLECPLGRGHLDEAVARWTPLQTQRIMYEFQNISVRLSVISKKSLIHNLSKFILSRTHMCNNVYIITTAHKQHVCVALHKLVTTGNTEITDNSITWSPITLFCLHWW